MKYVKNIGIIFQKIEIDNMGNHSVDFYLHRQNACFILRIIAFCDYASWFFFRVAHCKKQCVSKNQPFGCRGVACYAPTNKKPNNKKSDT